MAATLQEFRDIVYGILREEEDTSAYPLTLVDQFINAAQLRICTGRVKNPFNGKTVRKGQLPFLFVDKYYTNVAPTSLTADATVGATSITVSSTTNFPTSGYLYIAGNIIGYAGVTSTTFTGIPATGTGSILFAYQGGQQVSIAFALPADYGSPIQMIYNNRFKMQAQLYDNIYEYLNQFKGNNYGRNWSIEPYSNPYRIAPFYTIKDNAYMLIYNMNATNDMVLFRYEKLPTEMTTGASTTIITNDTFAKTTIPYLAVGEMLYNRGEEERASQILNFGLGQVKEMYDYYDNTSYEQISGVQYGMGKSAINF